MKLALEEYEKRLSHRLSLCQAQKKTNDQYSLYRLWVFVAGVIVLAASLGWGLLSVHWVWVPVFAFVVLIVLHELSLKKQLTLSRAADYYTQCKNRLIGKWIGTGVSGTQYIEHEHPYSWDLDIFGKGSLFEYLCRARTQSGERVLADWLKKRSSKTEILARQEAVKELQPKLNLREELALVGDDIRSAVHPDILNRWSLSEPLFSGARRSGVLLGLWFLTLSGPATLIAWQAWNVPVHFFFGVIVLSYLFKTVLKRPVEDSIGAVQEVSSELNVLASALEIFEREKFQSKRLVHLVQALKWEGHVASEEIHRLDKIVTWLDAKRNQFFAPFAFLLLWDVHIALALQKWRSRCGSRVPGWLDALGELEAICSLSGFAYDHGEHPFPEINEQGRCLEATQLGHPLLPENERISNDISLGLKERVCLVSGSNMSGKSTWLRTVGINSVLAFAGAPVCAKSFKLSSFQLAASIKAEDSLQSGTSRFYAELKKLGRFVSLSESHELLFLIDEVFHGTNSKDRFAGAEAFMRELIKRNAIGFLTTHDLSLTKISDSLKEGIRNVHFQDEIVDGKLVFDYKIREGVVERSNAIELMRSVGIPV